MIIRSLYSEFTEEGLLKIALLYVQVDGAKLL